MSDGNCDDFMKWRCTNLLTYIHIYSSLLFVNSLFGLFVVILVTFVISSLLVMYERCDCRSDICDIVIISDVWEVWLS